MGGRKHSTTCEKVKEQCVVDSKIQKLNTDNLIVNNKTFPTSVIPFKISETTVIVCPSGGLFALGSSFTGKSHF